VLEAIGLLTIVIGVREATQTANVVFPIVALVLGTLIGEALGIEERLAALGERMRRRFERGRAADAPPSRFVEGFVAASLLFCVGPLAILGSINDGIGGHDHAQLLIVKAALDGLVAVVFASTFGWGVAFSVVPIVIYQGGISLSAGAVRDTLTTRMVLEMTAAGGVMVVGIGLRLLDLKQVRVASMLPALVIAPVAVALFAR
jgi:uncharacterized membrane protein YqgA involved in biofilm formation